MSVAYSLPEQNEEVKVLFFNKDQADLIKEGSQRIADLGGPDASGAVSAASQYAIKIEKILSPLQITILVEYSLGKLNVLIFDGLRSPANDPIPNSLPSLEALEKDQISLELASRSQILLAMIKNRAFAYDIDNNGKVVRFVANFNGGGKVKLPHEIDASANLSSHSGVALGAHTEAPYYSTKKPVNGHSPAPSTLILTARWNIKNEPTSIIPIQKILEKIGGYLVMGLTLPYFSFTRSDSFVQGKGEGINNTSILDIKEDGRITIRFNTYRTYVEEKAPKISKIALEKLREQIDSADIIKVNLQPNNVIAINNHSTLHGRDIVTDNRRLLIRLFGYGIESDGIELCEDPLLIQG